MFTFRASFTLQSDTFDVKSKTKCICWQDSGQKSICLYLILLPVVSPNLSPLLSCLPCSEEDGEQEDKTIWYYSTKVNGTLFFLNGGVLCQIIMFFLIALCLFLTLLQNMYVYNLDNTKYI